MTTTVVATAEPDGLPTEPCAHCGTAMIRTVNTVGGDLLLIDAAPSADGDVLLARVHRGVIYAGVASPGVARSAARMGRTLHLQHARTCPYASRSANPGRRRPTGRRRR